MPLKPANDPAIDYRALVQRGYDQCAAPYEEERRNAHHPELALLMDRLVDGAMVLDIGCGSGVPIAQALAQRHMVTGVDVSHEQIRRARINVPNGNFLHADIMTVDFPVASFDAVVAFYSIFHLPRESHAPLFQRIHTWLKPAGYLLATVSQFREAAYTEDDFFGVTMYWSNYGVADYHAMLQALGFQFLETTIIGHGYTDVHAPAEDHPLVFAQRGAEVMVQ